jgi:hypothetical protein
MTEHRCQVNAEVLRVTATLPEVARAGRPVRG